LGNQKKRGLFGDIGIDGRIICKYTFKKQVVKMWIGFIWFRI
jgi:hypothetical protein